MSDGAIERILVVCTANQCRSPIGAAMLADRLARRDLAATVASAGTQAMEGAPATDGTVRAAARYGIDLSHHRSRRTDPEMVDTAQLIVTMERHHLREVVVLDPTAFARSFTLKELVRRGTEIGPRTPGETGGDWLERVHAGRRSLDLLGASAVDDVEDPTGNRFTDHESMAAEVSELTDRMVELLWPSGGERAAFRPVRSRPTR